MPRREPYSRVVKHGQDRPAHVRGQGDVVFKVLQCLAEKCQAWIAVPRAEIRPGFRLRCEVCQHKLRDGESTRFFDYDLLVEGQVVESSDFVVDHGEYVRDAPDYKYCLLCYTLKPLDAFGRHGSRPESGRQGECTSCKTAYNRIKNKTRITEQHREASERRRLLGLLGSDTPRVDRDEIRRKFGHRCFSCDTNVDEQNEAFDHTLPVRLLWPMTTENATLLCTTCNGQKSARWPSEFYDEQHLRRLAVLTSIPYEVLTGEPTVNEQAVAMIREDPDAFLADWIHRPGELGALSRLVKETTGVYIFENATTVPGYIE